MAKRRIEGSEVNSILNEALDRPEVQDWFVHMGFNETPKAKLVKQLASLLQKIQLTRTERKVVDAYGRLTDLTTNPRLAMCVFESEDDQAVSNITTHKSNIFHKILESMSPISHLRPFIERNDSKREIHAMAGFTILNPTSLVMAYLLSPYGNLDDTSNWGLAQRINPENPKDMGPSIRTEIWRLKKELPESVILIPERGGRRLERV